MFWILFLFRGRLTREPTSVVGDNERGDLFHSAGRHRNPRWPQPTQEQLGRGLEKNEGGLTGKVKMSKEYIPGRRRSMHGYKVTYCRL